jgi:hypothetical protein
LLELGNHCGELVRQENVVAVEEGQKAGPRSADTSIAGSVASGMFIELDDPHARVAVGAYDVRRAIARPVVDDNQLEVVQVLGKHAVDRARKDA